LQPHQIECNGASIVCANSGRNCITVFGLDLSPHHCYPTTARYDIGAGERKANHFNSVHISGGVLYVLAHNYANPSAVWMFGWPSLELIDVVGTNTSWSHNIMRNDADCWVCNSKAGAVYSLREHRDIWTMKPGGFITRGLAATSDYLFVGLTPVAARGDRKNCDSAICVLDRNTLGVLQTYRFEAVGGIHEIRLLDVADDCHGGRIIPAEWLPTRDRTLPSHGQGLRRPSSPPNPGLLESSPDIR
jgi:hypothetical protein